MYLGMNRREMSGLLALLGIIVLGVASQSYVRRNRGGNLWIQHEPKKEKSGALSPEGDWGKNSPGRKTAAGAFREDGRLDLNLARVEDLETFAGIGPQKARAIVDYRRRVGGFKDPGELLEVSGIGEVIWRTLEPSVFVASPEKPEGGVLPGVNRTSPGLKAVDSAAGPVERGGPGIPLPVEIPFDASGENSQVVNINTASEAELQALWNVGPRKSQAIVRWRRLHGSFRRPDDLMKVSGIGPETLRRNRARIRVK